MNRRKRPFWLLIIAISALIGLIFLILSYSPNSQFSVSSYKLPILPIFFLIFLAFLLSLITYLIRSFKRAALIGGLTVIYLAFRMFQLGSPYFLALLLALYISLELFFKKQQK